MSREDCCTAEVFLRDVGLHRMVIKRDEGLYRHLSFRQSASASWNMWFDLVTWPGVLTIHGDMGTWTFARVEDMFTFFRDDKLRVNKSYWAEKLQHGASGGRDEARVFSDDLFKERLVVQLTEYYSLEGAQLTRVTEALQDEVLSQDCKYDLLIAARDFRCGDFQFDTCELPDGKDYSYHFVWCLYAIVWGIQRYDAASVPSTSPASPTAGLSNSSTVEETSTTDSGFSAEGSASKTDFGEPSGGR